MKRGLIIQILICITFFSCSKSDSSTTPPPTPVVTTPTTPVVTTPTTPTISDYKNKTNNQIRLESKIWDYWYDADALYYGDIDLDGDEDIFNAVQNNNSFLRLNDGKNNFSITKISDANSVFVFPRSIIGNDFNGDGYLDYVVLAHNNEQLNPNPGEIPSLFMNDKKGGFSVSKLNLKSGFWHLGCSADIDKDGDADLLVCTAGSINIMINDGKGNFTLDNSKLPSSYANCNLIGGMLEDFNGDGFIDLLVYGHEYNDLSNAPYPSKTRILYGSSSFTFSENNSLTIDSDKLGYGVILDALFVDLNNDNKKELILVRTGDPLNYQFYKGYKIQILNGSTDVTSNFIDNAFNRTESSINWIKVLDVNGDGKKDIVEGPKRRSISFVQK